MDKKAENRRFWKSEEKKLEARVQEALNPGGDKAVQRLAKFGKRPVRELIQNLIDPGTTFYELSRIAGFGMHYPGVEDVPCAGVVTGIGKVHGNWTMIFANDSRVKAGTYFPITLKKHMRAQFIAERCGLNCVYIADSGGAFLPMQADVFPDDQHFGSMFFNMARMSAQGLKQIAQLIKADLGLEIACIDVGGWDTHINQIWGNGGPTHGRMHNLMRMLDEALLAFYLDLGQRWLAHFDLAALGGFVWALWMLYGLWRDRQKDKD